MEQGFELAFELQVVREHYLRDDIYCGAPFCRVCDVSGARLSSNASTVIVVDTNVVLHQVSFLYFFEESAEILVPLTGTFFNFAHAFVLFVCFIRLICWKVRP